MKQKITILGSTGSIGVSTLDVIARHPDRYEVVALTGHTRVEELAHQCAQFHPAFAVFKQEPGIAALDDGRGMGLDFVRHGGLRCVAGGPKAHSIPAWGSAPGQENEIKSRAESPFHRLVPHISFIEFDSVFCEKRPIFFLKRPRPVMLFLGVKVMSQRIQIRRADGKCAVATLPREVCQGG